MAQHEGNSLTEINRFMSKCCALPRSQDRSTRTVFGKVCTPAIQQVMRVVVVFRALFQGKVNRVKEDIKYQFLCQYGL